MLLFVKPNTIELLVLLVLEVDDGLITLVYNILVLLLMYSGRF